MTSDSDEEQKDSPTPVERSYAMRLSPEEVSLYWDEIVESVTAGLELDPRDIAPQTGVMNGIQSGKVACWAIFDATVKKKPRLVGISTTLKAVDPYTGVAELLVYSMHSKAPLKWPARRDVDKAFHEYAKVAGCKKVVARCAHAVSERICKKLGYQLRPFAEKDVA